MNPQDLNTKGGKAHFADLLPILPDNGTQTARLHFDSLAELVSYVPNKAPPGRDSAAWTASDPSFYGCTMAQARDMAREGWSAGAERVIPLLDRVKTERPSAKRITRYDVAGAVAVVPRYLAGNPLAMRRHETTQSNKYPIITIVSGLSAMWNVRTSVFEAMACAAAAVTDRLENAGFRVELISGSRSSSDDKGVTEASGKNNSLGYRSEVFFRIKGSDEALNLSRAAFGLGHPGAFRRLVFALRESHPDFDKSLCGVQGYAIALDAIEDRPSGVYIMPAIPRLHKISPNGDPVAVFDEVIKTLKAQGCPGLE